MDQDFVNPFNQAKRKISLSHFDLFYIQKELVKKQKVTKFRKKHKQISNIKIQEWSYKLLKITENKSTSKL